MVMVTTKQQWPEEGVPTMRLHTTNDLLPMHLLWCAVFKGNVPKMVKIASIVYTIER